MTITPTPLPPADAQRVADVLSRYRQGVVAAMRDALNHPGVGHVRYMRYHLGWEDVEGRPAAASGGKLLRPAICLLCCEAVGGDATRALPAAAAIELLHNFTLIHDDIEDSSDTRHGRATLWRVAGVAQAINAGDGMFVFARRSMLRLADSGVPPERILDATRLLDDASIALCEGQHEDIIFETRARVTVAEYEAMVAGKTSALLGASMAIGGVAGGADRATVEALASCGIKLGLAFQIRDDVLGIWGDESVTGKSSADDVRAKKKSFPVVYAFDHLDAPARKRLEDIYAKRELTDGHIDVALALLDQAGAREASNVAAARSAATALDMLRPLQLDDGRRADLEALASFFVHRVA